MFDMENLTQSLASAGSGHGRAPSVVRCGGEDAVADVARADRRRQPLRGPHRDGADSHRRRRSRGALRLWRQYAGVLYGCGTTSQSLHTCKREKRVQIRYAHDQRGKSSAGCTTSSCAPDAHPCSAYARLCTGCDQLHQTSARFGNHSDFLRVVLPILSDCSVAEAFG